MLASLLGERPGGNETKEINNKLEDKLDNPHSPVCRKGAPPGGEKYLHMFVAPGFIQLGFRVLGFVTVVGRETRT